MTSVRRATLVSAVVFLTIGLLRGAIQIALYARTAGDALTRVGFTVSIALFWVPVSTLVVSLLRRPLDRRRAMALLLALGMVTIVLNPAWILLVYAAGAPKSASYLAILVSGVDTSALFYVAIVGTAWAANAWSQQTAQRRAAASLDTALADAELHILTLQLHPHFLFNTLNLVSQLAFENGDEARGIIRNLRSLLVESLRHAALREVRLEDEMRFLRAYLDIQLARFRSRLAITLDIAPNASDAMVPHLLLQPLVENAIVHGIAPLPEGGAVHVEAKRAGDRLIVRVADSGGGIALPVRERMGLTNARLRLAQLFGDDFDIELSRGRAAGAVATVKIPFRLREVAELTTNPALDSPAGPPDGVDAVASRRAPLWLQIVMCWAGIAVLWTELDATTQTALGTGVTWNASAVASVMNAVIWLLLTPIAILMARHADIASGFRWRRLATHLAVAVGIAVVHVPAWLSLLSAFVPTAFRAQYGNRFAWGFWDVAAYFTIVAFTLIVRLASRRRETQLAMAETRARLATARLASMRLHLQPAVLLAALDAIDTLVVRDAARAERAITRMGDLLRCLLATGQRSVVELGEELEMLHAFVDVTAAAVSAENRELERPVDTTLLDAAIPAMLLAPLAAALGGAIREIVVDERNDEVRVRLTSDAAAIDTEALAKLRVRVEALDGIHLHVAGNRGLTTAELRLPARRMSRDAELTRDHEHRLAIA